MRKLAGPLAIIALVGVVALYAMFRIQNAKVADDFKHLKERVGLLESKDTQKQVTTRTLNIYFTKNADQVVATKRTLPGDKDREELLEAAFGALLAGPTAEEQNRGLSNQIPAHAKLLDVEVKDDLAYLDFSRELEEVGGSARVRGILKQIGFTATAVPGIRGAWLLIEGKRVQVFSGEGLIIDQPLSRAGGPGF
jgi:spore germination protein GerM